MLNRRKFNLLEPRKFGYWADRKDGQCHNLIDYHPGRIFVEFTEETTHSLSFEIDILVSKSYLSLSGNDLSNEFDYTPFHTVSHCFAFIC